MYKFVSHRFLIICFMAMFGVGVMLPINQAQAKYASYIIDANTGEVLHGLNHNTRNYPASLTKIMTLYMLFDALEKGKVRLHHHIKVSRRASGQPPSRLGLKPGQKITVEQAIYALVTKSANDVATAVAEFLGGSEKNFAKQMTKKAKEIGMSRTSFRNASGLPNRAQLSTAKDMATLGLRIQQDFPQYYPFFATKKFKFKSKTYKNHNKLLGKYQGIDGIKTGYTRASGFNLVTSVRKDGHHVIGVVFGGKTGKIRDRHMEQLLDKGFAKLKRQYGIRQADNGLFPRPPIPSDSMSMLALANISEALTAKKTRNTNKQANHPKPPIPIAQGDIDDVKDQSREIALRQTPDGGLFGSTVGLSEPNLTRIVSQMGSWVVQVGAFVNQKQALAAASNAQNRLSSRQQSVVIGHSAIYKPAKSRYFRSLLIGFTERAARQTCRSLKSQNIDCFAKQASLGLSG